MENKFIKGLILGGLLTAAAILGFKIKKEGWGYTKKFKEGFKPMAKHFKENFGKLHDVSKEDFDKLVTTLVEEYTKKKEISDDSKKTLITALKSKWDEIKN